MQKVYDQSIISAVFWRKRFMRRGRMVQNPSKEREKLAIELYREGKISPGKATEIAAISYEKMKELSIEYDVEIRRGSASLKEMKTKAKELTEIL